MIDSEGNEIEQQNVTRFYISKGEGSGSLIKIMPPVKNKTEDRRIGICVGETVKICNDIDDFKWDIDYDYYIKEALKLTDLSYSNDDDE